MHATRLGILAAVTAALLARRASAGDPGWSDPAGAAAPPAHAVGFPDRSPTLDALPGFHNPPPGYGEVAFYWWLGDPLTKDRLAWEVEQLAGKGVMGLQVNYAHSDRGGRSYGLTIPSDPPLFSEEWWKLYGWFLKDARRHGMATSLSDYTLGIGQGWYVDEVIRDNPELRGSVLRHAVRDLEGGREAAWEVPESLLALEAYRVADGRLEPGSGVDLRPRVSGREVRWQAPTGRWQAVAVSAEAQPFSVDPLNPRTGPEVVKRFFQRFEDRNPGEAGKGLNFFFSDELGFGVAGNLWTPRFAEEFRKRKGYDLLPELPALFVDIGPRTPKVRLDYRDVMVSLEEAGYFRPLFDWHQQRGMIYGCDHGGRGRDVTEFGDYFRTQRWNQGPGSDQPGLARDLIKAKVASSIAHLYQRPRVWIEGYYGSGWDTSSAQIADATFANFAQGYNLLTLHGLYYSTHGGWWEWAPPDNHFRMPYWAHMGAFLQCAERLSYLLSQGHHRCDYAVLYPVAPAEAGVGGGEAVQTAFGIGEALYRAGVDFDFMDFESLDRAKVQGHSLAVSGETYYVLILPAMRAIRWSTLQKALEFQRAGGCVFAVGAPPEASDRAGREDPELAAAVADLLGKPGHYYKATADLVDAVTSATTRDFTVLAARASPSFMHRRVGPRDVYMVYGLAKGTECWFRAIGRTELWDPWTGAARPLRVVEQTFEGTRLRMPLTEAEPQVIVFSPGTPDVEPPGARATNAASVVTLGGDWEFELQPSLDNRWGDYRWPPFEGFIGAEARQFRYQPESAPNPGWQQPGLDDSAWPRVTQAFGPQFWKLGPLPENADVSALEAQLAATPALDPAAPVAVAGRSCRWQPYEFSWRWGIQNDPGHQGYHGLKEEMHDEFIGLGKLTASGTGTGREKEEGGGRYYLWTAVTAPKDMPARLLAGGMAPAALWLNGARVAARGGAVSLRGGANPLLIRYDAPGRGFVVATTAASGRAAGDAAAPFSSAAAWIWTPGATDSAAGWFRRAFDVATPPREARLRITCDNGYTVFLNGAELGSGDRWETVQEFDVKAKLRRGANVLAVHARNEGSSAGLIAELVMESARGAQRVATDGSWRCAGTEAPGWKEPAFDDRPWGAAQVISPFEGSLWATHPHGPPALEAPPPPPQSAAKPNALAMSWYNDTAILPFDARPGSAAPAGWYRFTAPPGLRALTVAARGTIRAWADGKDMRVSPLPARKYKGVSTDLKASVWRAEVVEPARGCAQVALRIEQERGCYGGAALPEPVLLDCAPGAIAPGDWGRIDGLACYSGGAWYRKTVALAADQLRDRVVLDLGRVVSSAEVRVNGKPAGIRVAPPWTVDITAAVKAGENRIDVLVYNTLANHYTTIPTRYRGAAESGLLGPVTIQLGP